MISYSAQSGEAEVVENDTSVIVSLQDFVGTLSIDSDCETLRIIVRGNCQITNSISLKNHEKLDIIKIASSDVGENLLQFNQLSASSVTVECNSIGNAIAGNVIRIENCTLQLKPNTDNSEYGLVSAGHVWVVDSTLTSDGFESVAKTPYFLIDNSSLTLTSKAAVIGTKNEVSIVNCSYYSYLTSYLETYASVIDTETNRPKQFQYVILKNPDGSYSGVIDRRKLFMQVPAILATPYDKFKHSTQYTNVDLHRWLDQHAEEAVDGAIPNVTIDHICRNEEFVDGIDQAEISDGTIDRICDGTYVYDGHPHDSVPIKIVVVDDIMRGTYHFANDSELYRQNYSVGIYSLESFRTSQIPLYSEGMKYREENEIP